MDFHFEPTVVRLSPTDASVTPPREHFMAVEIAGVRFQVRDLAGLATLAGIILTVRVVVEELRKPPQSRTWQGKLWGVLPYDLRPPTIERVWRTLWRPEVERLFTEKAFGIGWDLNLAALRRHPGHGHNGDASGHAPL